MFNNAVSTAYFIQHRLMWGDDHEL